MRLNKLVVRNFSIAILLISFGLALTNTRAQDPPTEAKAAHPNRARGESSGESNQFDLVDSVNLYNGALTLNIPLGQQYLVGGNLTYSLTLYYNSNFWDFLDVPVILGGRETNLQVKPDREAYNAGLGWRLSLGSYGGGSYTAPDGSNHRLYHELHVTDDESFANEKRYTRDGTYLRGTPSQRMLEFPNGEVHHFHPDGTLSKINDHFGNELNLYKRDNGGGTSSWVLRDSANRTHYINFDAGGKVTSVDLASFNGTRAQYNFGYQFSTLDNHKRTEVSVPLQDRNVHLLTSLSLPGDAGSYSFSYRNDNSLQEAPVYNLDPTGPDGGYSPGALATATLPTGGQYIWTYQEYKLDRRNPETDAAHPDPFRIKDWVSGVRTKQLIGRNIVAGRSKWKYHQYADDEPGPSQGIIESRTLVESPERDFTVNHFADSDSEWKAGLPISEYPGHIKQLPDGKKLFLSQEIYKGAVAEKNKRRAIYLRYECDIPFSKNQFPQPGDPDNPTTGLKEANPPDNNRRIASQLTEFFDDPRPDGTPRYQQTDYSDFDGLGHYRRQETKGDFTAGNPVRVTFTNYNPENGEHNFDPETFGKVDLFDPKKGPMIGQWLLDTYTETRTSEAGKVAVSEYHFEPTTGFLVRVRKLGTNAVVADDDDCRRINPVPWNCPRGATDVVIQYSRNSFGSRTVEEYFGGDKQATIPNAHISDLSLTSPAYKLVYTYGVRPALNTEPNALPLAQDYGSIRTKKYEGTGFFLVNKVSIDGNTGLTKTENDSAGLATSFEYDLLGRVTWVKPTSGAWTEFDYDFTPFLTVKENKRKNGDQTAAGIIAQTEKIFDSFGRIAEDKQNMAGAVSAGEVAWNIVETKHNAMGWKESVSERKAFSPTATGGVTRFSNFDAFGRPTDITPPDGSAHAVKMIYGGNRTVTRKVRVGTQRGANPGIVNEELVETTEVYDNFGRLARVIEDASPSGSPVPIRKNFALQSEGATATALNSAGTGFPESAANDGVRTAVNWGQGGGWNDGSEVNYSTDWVNVNFRGAKEISSIRVFTLRPGFATRTDDPGATCSETFNNQPNTDQGIVDFDVQYVSSYGWKTVPGGRITGNNRVCRQISFPPIVTSAIRVAVHKSVVFTNVGNNYSRIVEVEAYGRDVGGQTSGAEQVWVEDSPPPGSSLAGNWNWIAANPTPFSGNFSHQSDLVPGAAHQHYFTTTQPLQVNVGDMLFTYIYIDPANPPAEVMLQWFENNSWEHRVYWGANQIPWGVDGTQSRRFMGQIPLMGQWVRLEVPANQVGLEGKMVSGMAFTLFGGRASFDKAGKLNHDEVWSDDAPPQGASVAGPWLWLGSNPTAASGNLSHQSELVNGSVHQHYFFGATQTLNVNPGDTLFAYVYLDPANPPREVMLQWGDSSGWEHRAYWGENLIDWGVDGTASRFRIGPLPPAGQWVRLEVPANLVGLEGRTAVSMAFTLFSGRANFDRAGKRGSAPSGSITNVAHRNQGAVASASSQFSHLYPVTAINDGFRMGRNWGQGGDDSGWSDATENVFNSDWLQINFPDFRTIDEINVFTLRDNYASGAEPTLAETFTTSDNGGNGITYFEVQYWDGFRWITLDCGNPASPCGLVTNNNKVWRQFTFSPITTRRIRVAVRDAVVWTAIPNNYSRIVEVEAKGQQQQPAGVEGGGSFVAEYNYDVGNRLSNVRLISPAGTTQQRSFNYDNRGFLLSEQHPESGKTRYLDYDAMGNAWRQQQVNVNNVSLDPNFDLKSTYDLAGRLTNLESANGRQIKKYMYGSGMTAADRSNGKVIEAKRFNYQDNWNTEFPVVEVYTYGGVGGAVSQRRTQVQNLPFGENRDGATGVVTFLQSFVYNDLGQVISTSYPRCAFAPCNAAGTQSSQQRTVEYAYASGLLTGIDEKVNSTLSRYASLTYHHNGMTKKINLGPAATISWEQEIDSATMMARPTRILLKKGSANTLWNSGVYGYDGAGNIKSIGTDSYVYDKLNRLVDGEVTTQHVNPSNGQFYRWRQQYGYDSFGNATSITTFDGNGARTDRTLAISTDTNRDTGSTYDAAGNVTRIVKYAMTWDGVNAMKSLKEDNAPDNQWYYIYSADGERVVSYNDNATVGKPGNIHMYYFRLRGLSNQVLREYVYNADSTVWTWTKDYVYGGSKLLASHGLGNNRFYFSTDHLGTPRRMMTDTGATMESNDFLPFGQAASFAGSAGDPLKFTGHERDTNGVGTADDLDYMHARYYTSYIARFLSVDPGEDHQVTKPQSWNKYSYVRNNPVSFSDPTGKAGKSQLPKTNHHKILNRTINRVRKRLTGDCLELFDQLNPFNYLVNNVSIGTKTPLGNPFPPSELAFAITKHDRDAQGQRLASGQTVFNAESAFFTGLLGREKFPGKMVTEQSSVSGLNLKQIRDLTVLHEIYHANDVSGTYDDFTDDPVLNLERSSALNKLLREKCGFP